MYKLLLFASLFLTVFSISAAKIIDDEHVTKETDCFTGIFADYDSWHQFIAQKNKRKAKNEKAYLKRIKAFEETFPQDMFDNFKTNLTCHNFKYKVDDVEVLGYIIKPKVTKNKLPVLIYNRGGNGNFGNVYFAAMMRNLFPLAEQGFVVIGSQYRGTLTKNDELDEFGGKDVNDVLALIDFIPHIAGADENRIGMLGVSRGGMQTHLAMQHTNKVKAIATIAGATDLVKELTFRPNMEKHVYVRRIPNYKENKQAELEARSVMNWVDKLSPKVPILLIHGSEDKRVSVENSIQFAKALEAHHIPHKLVVYEGDNHFLMNHKKQLEAELVNWFNTNL